MPLLPRLALVLLGLVALPGSLTAGGFPSMPVSGVLALQPGAATTVRFGLGKRTRVGVLVRFLEDGPTVDAARLHDLLGGARKSPTGAWEERGVPAAFRVTITARDATTTPIVVQADRPRTAAAHRARVAILTEADLDAGRYEVAATVLSADGAVKPVRAELVVAPPHHGK